MPDDEDVAPAAVRRLPPAALAGLREAFAGEVAERLPRLREAVRTAEPELLAAALRDAHALASSAVVVGEPGASRCARDAELLLLRWQQDPDGAEGRAVLPQLGDRVRDLHSQLAGWRV